MNEYSYSLLSINLKYFDDIQKRTLLDWIKTNTRVFLRSVNITSSGYPVILCDLQSIRVIVENPTIHKTLIESIHKIVFPELKPCNTIIDNYKLTEEEKYEWTRKNHNIRDSRNSNIVNNPDC
jgi:hypothetical protein